MPYPAEYALANAVDHPKNVYLREADAVPPLDVWLAHAFRPDQLAETIEALFAAQDGPDAARDAAVEAAKRTIAEADQRLARHRAALEAGTNPALIARWTAEVNAERTLAENQLRQATGRTRMTAEEIRELIAGLGNLVEVLHRADPADKAVYQRLGLKLTYDREAHTLAVASRPNMSDLWVFVVPEDRHTR